jgi:uncharacterized protein involved in outer membrane biogenesis
MSDQTATRSRIVATLIRRRVLVLCLLAAVGAYAAAGFWFVPWIIKRELPGAIQAAVNRQAEIGVVEFNPFVLGLRVSGFKLRDRDGSTLAAVDELYVNAQLSSLFRRAAAFAEFHLRHPYLHVVRDAAGDINLLKLIPATDDRQSAKPGEPARPLAIIIEKAILSGGVVDLEDRGTHTPFKARLGPMDLRVSQFSTRPDESGQQNLDVTLESGTQIRVAATTTMTPLRSSGTVTIKGPLLGIAYRYLHDRLAFELAGSEQDISARFSLAAKPGGALEASVENLSVAVLDTHLRNPANVRDFLAVRSLRLSGGRLAWPARTVSADELTVEGLALTARREATGEIDLNRLLTIRPAEPGVPTPSTAVPDRPPTTPAGQKAVAVSPESATAWRVSLGKFAVKDASLGFRDEARATPAELGITGLEILLSGISTEPQARFNLQSRLTLAGGGTVAVEGAIGALPDVVADTRVKIEGIGLAQFQPWVSDVARVVVRDGALQFAGQLTSAPGEVLALTGDARVTALETLDGRKNERLLAWSELALDDLRFAATGRSLKISRVRLSKPYARVFVAKDQSTNIGDLLVAGDATSAGTKSAPGPAPPTPAAKPFAVRLSKLLVAGGSADYTDLSLPLPFAAHIEALHGDATAIDTRSEEPSKMALEGQVGKFGLARINGLLRASAPTDLADIALVFRNVEMTTLSPYTVKFAGHKIAGGRLNLDLRYKLDHRRMVGENKVVIDQLELGEKVPSPEAINIPLGLAIALLKDSDGRIDIDMPVSGSLDDPQFRIGPVIWKAFVTLITRIVTSPFRLLGKLIGSESEDLGQIGFAPGRADLLPPEREKLLKVVDLLAKRPNLSVSVPAAVSVATDTSALKQARLEETVEKQLQAGKGSRGDSARDLDARTRRVVEELYAAAFPGQPLKALQERFTAAPPDQPKAKARFDEGAYVAELRRLLIDAQAVSPADLDALGSARAGEIRGALLAGGVADTRVRTGPRKDVDAKDAAVPLALELGGI